MFRTRIRKIFGDIRARKGRTALVSIAIFIGVVGTISLFSMGDILVSQLREDIKEDELAMLSVFVTSNAGAELDNEAYLQNLRSISGVTEVMGEVNAIAYFKLDAADEDFKEGGLTAFSAPYEPRLPLTPMRLIDGAYPTQGADEIVIEQRMAEKYDLQVGDQIFVRVLSASKDETQNGALGTTEARMISGIVFHPYAGNGGGFGNARPEESMYSLVDDAGYILGLPGYTIFLARFVDYPTAESQIETFAGVLANDTPYIPVFKFPEDPAQNGQIQGAQTISVTMGVLALIALIVSGFLVINVVSSIVIEQKRQIGVMKSIGASRWDNFFIYAGIAFVYGLIGVIPGVILGIPLGNAAATTLAPTLNTVIDGFRISPPSIMMGVIVGLLVPVLAALIPVYFGTRVKILDAMTDLGIDANYGNGPLAKIIGALPIPITVRQGLSNVSIKKSRLLFTVITLSIAAGAFMGIFAVFSSFTQGIDIFLDAFNVEVGIVPNEAEDPDVINQILLENFQTGDNNVIKTVEPGFQYQIEFDGYNPPIAAGGPPGIFAYGYDTDSPTPAFNVTVDEGQEISEENRDNGIIFSSLLASNMGKTIGDTVVLKVPGNSAEFTIVGISEYPLEQVWIDWRPLAKVAGFTAGAPKPNEYFTLLTVDGYTSDQPDGSVGAVGLDTQFAGFLPFSEGEFFTIGEPGVIVSQSLADKGSYSVGDTLSLTASTGTGESLEAPIVGIFTIPPLLQSADIPEDVIGIYWQDLVSLEGLSLDGKPVPQGYWMISNLENPTVDELDKILKDMTEVFLANGIQFQGLNFVELTNQISQGFLIFQVILQAVALLIALVGALGLLTTLSMSVFERQKEIGVMRSIGASSATVATQFLTEGLVVGMIAWLVGLPLAYGIEVGLLNATGFIETFPATFPVTAAIIGLIGMLVITTFSSLWPSLSAARRTVSDILRYQ